MKTYFYILRLGQIYFYVPPIRLVKKSLQETATSLSLSITNETPLIELETLVEDVEKQRVTLIFWGTIPYSESEIDETKWQLLETFEEEEATFYQTKDALYSAIKNLNPVHLRNLLGNDFILQQLYQLYNLVTEEEVDKGNFYKLAKNNTQIKPTGHFVEDVSHRPPELYTWDIEDLPKIVY